MEAVLIDASRLVEGTQRGLGQLRRELRQLWTATRPWWRENQGRALHTAVFVLLVALVRVATGVGCVAACFLAVLAVVPCALLALVLGAVCVHVWTLVRCTPTTAHIAMPAGWVDSRCYVQIGASLWEERGGESLCREEEEDEVDEEEEARCDACADCWCRHISSKTNSVTEAVRHRLRRNRVSTPYYVGKTSKQSLGPRTVLGSKEWETMTLQQLCFPSSGLGELVDAVGAIQRTPY